jgi:glucose/arabinose dehydrogenase
MPILVLLALVLLVGCGTGQGAPQAQYRLVPAFPALSFDEPLDLQSAPDGSGQLFVVEKGGRIRAFLNRADNTDSRLFLDLSGRVYDKGEGGLLGLAFHPAYSRNGHFFVYYTLANPRRVVISRFTRDASQSDVELKSERVILEVPYPDRYSNHNAGAMVFGPGDGLLYLGMGDGGGGGDPLGSGQDRKSLLGKILRIDVDRAAPGRHYAIPKDNPFVGNRAGWREEIWAWGLRNPWRISFDMTPSGQQRLWAADVGQNAMEEIDLIERGHNYGWNVMEGSRCYSPPSGCARDGLSLPVAEYGHDWGRSIIGGHVYRGRRLPDLVGQYLFADFISGRVGALIETRGHFTIREIARLSGRVPAVGRVGIAALGRDANGEIYAVDHIAGKLLRLEASE